MLVDSENSVVKLSSVVDPMALKVISIISEVVDAMEGEVFNKVVSSEGISIEVVEPIPDVEAAIKNKKE